MIIIHIHVDGPECIGFRDASSSAGRLPRTSRLQVLLHHRQTPIPLCKRAKSLRAHALLCGDCRRTSAAKGGVLGAQSPAPFFVGLMQGTEYTHPLFFVSSKSVRDTDTRAPAQAFAIYGRRTMLQCFISAAIVDGLLYLRVASSRRR